MIDCGLQVPQSNSFDVLGDQLHASILLHYATLQLITWYTAHPRLCIIVPQTLQQII